MWGWQCGSRGGDSGSTAAAASLEAEAAAWRKYDFSGSSLAFGSAAAVWQQLQQQHGIGGVSVACADDNCNGHNYNND